MELLRQTVNPFLRDPTAPNVMQHPRVTRENIVMTAKLREQLPLPQVAAALLCYSSRFSPVRPRVLIQTTLGTANIYARSIVITGAHSEDGGRLLLDMIMLALMRYDPNDYQPPEVRYATVLAAAADAAAPPPAPPPTPDTASFPVGADDEVRRTLTAILGSSYLAGSANSSFVYDVRLQNMVGCVRTGHQMSDLWTMKNHIVPEANYNPKLFPGLMSHMTVTRPDGRQVRVAVTFHTSGSAIITGATCDWDLWNAACWACATIWETHKVIDQQHSQDLRLRVLCSNGYIGLSTQLREAQAQEREQRLAGAAAVVDPNRAVALVPVQLRKSAAILQHYGSAAAAATAAASAPPTPLRAVASASGSRIMDSHQDMRAHARPVLAEADLDEVRANVQRINDSLARLQLASSASSSRAASPSPSPQSRSRSLATSASTMSYATASRSAPDISPAAAAAAASSHGASPVSPSPSSVGSTPTTKRSTTNLAEQLAASPSKRHATPDQRTGATVLPLGER